MSDTIEPGFVEHVRRMGRDLRAAAATLSDREARFLVDAYYAMQRDRIRADHQSRTLNANAEPHAVMGWLGEERETLERQVHGALDVYSKAHPAGVWARGIIGVGPVIAAGLLANIDIKHCPTVGHLWRFAGLDPTCQWLPETKRPWNANLKRLCFLIGESFVKFQNNDKDIYGKVYATRKEYEQAKNAKGDYAEQAAAALKNKRYGKDTEARRHYEKGQLPPARIHLRAKRYAVKLFLSHLHHVMYELEFNAPPPKPYIIQHGGHVHFLAPPNWP